LRKAIVDRFKRARQRLEAHLLAIYPGFRDLENHPAVRSGGSFMPCLLLILVLAFPRIILALLFVLSNYLQRAYHHSLLIPLIGFIFLPLTTLAYAWMVNNRMPLEGVNLLILLLAVIIDAGGLGGGAYHRRSRL
jgi:hypothetical protein